jgi:hypothetical protein
MTTPPDPDASAPSPPRGSPFQKGHDPRRFRGAPGVGGAKKDKVRAACLRGVEEGLPIVLALLHSEEPLVALKAFEALAKYGLGPVTELDARLEHAVSHDQPVVYFYLPDNGRNVRSPTLVPSLPPTAPPAELDDEGEPLPEGIFRWRDGSFMSFPEP